jgi:hypothetical protein
LRALARSTLLKQTFLIDSVKVEPDISRQQQQAYKECNTTPPTQPIDIKPVRKPPIHRPFLPWNYPPIDSSESDLNDLQEEGSASDSDYSSASSSQYQHTATPPYVGQTTDLSTVAEDNELAEDKNGFSVPDAINFSDWEDHNLSQVRLPHVPLRPFRNQVGGHSAIYKFTTRAVCKVSQE